MCGIFGTISGNIKSLGQIQRQTIVRKLSILSETRGREASGFAGINSDQIAVIKSPLPASQIVKTNTYKDFISLLASSEKESFAVIGHSRLVTNGYEQFNYNNQPIVKNEFTGIHNGIIVNINDLWVEYQNRNRETDLDTEIIPIILEDCLNTNQTIKDAIKTLFIKIYGTANIAFFLKGYKNLFLASNNGSLYYLSNSDLSFFAFASERYILEQLLSRNKSLSIFAKNKIHQIKPENALSVNIENLTIDELDLQSNAIEFNNLSKQHTILGTNHISTEYNDTNKYVNRSLESLDYNPPEKFKEEYYKRKEQIDSLVRCKKCVLPETFPFIEFNQDGICNYCRNYQKIEYKGITQLLEEIERYKTKKSSPDCLMPFSGGRDSSFTLHYAVKILGLKPIAFSYDWGMITDLGRRNQARICGELGIEHIIISADIRTKRKNIQKNVLAWCKRPNLGTVPLFMAGDKQYFYHAARLMKQNNLRLSILGENMLETTMFKSGFCGIAPKFGTEHTYSLSSINKLKMLTFYAKEFILNPSYINNSLFDTLDAFRAYYIQKHHNLNLFDFIEWEEDAVNETLIQLYNWEVDKETNTTWRIGDGTAAFYNYIYYMFAGFSENDTFRSNQIREGSLSREKGLELVQEENQPRWNSMYWYSNTIQVQIDHLVNTVHGTKLRKA